MTRAAFITQWFPPEPAPVTSSIARALSECGFETKVLSGVPNYPRGKVFEGYSPWRSQKDEIDGIQIQRAPLYPDRSSSTFKRGINYLSFSASASVAAKPILANADVALVYGSPATTAIPALYAKRRWGTPFVFMVQDLWPDSVFSTGFLDSGMAGNLASRSLHKFVNHVYQEASHIIAISPGMVNEIEQRGVSRKKISLIYNWADETDYSSTDDIASVRSKLGFSQDDFLLLYAGNQGFAQGLDAWIEAMKRIEGRSRSRLLLIGSGACSDQLKNLVSKLSLERVNFIHDLARADLEPYIRASDAMVISLSNEKLFDITIPGKTQSCLYSGKPILASANGDVAALVSNSGSGLIAEPSNSELIAKCILLAESTPKEEWDKKGLNGKQLYTDLMSYSLGREKLMEVLETSASSISGKNRSHQLH